MRLLLIAATIVLAFVATPALATTEVEALLIELRELKQEVAALRLALAKPELPAVTPAVHPDAAPEVPPTPATPAVVPPMGRITVLPGVSLERVPAPLRGW